MNAARRLAASCFLAMAMALLGCSAEESGGGRPGAGAGDSTAATPVRVDAVRRDTLRVIVTAPGRTQVLEEETVRAPFSGTLTQLAVIDGDRVAAGEVLPRMITRNSEATLRGAQAMLESALTAADSADAREALELARRDLVERTLEAPSAGVVLSHSASPGDRLGEGDEILHLAPAGSAVFVAQLPQNDLSSIRPGQSARIRLAARPDTLAGTVHGVMPAASSSGFSAPVRIDFGKSLPTPSVGLFGTASIIVGQRAGVLSVPLQAVLTDDVTGVSRLAVARSGRAFWVDVRTGITDRGRIQVAGPGIAPGVEVVVSGQVGLPDSAAVRIRP